MKGGRFFYHLKLELYGSATPAATKAKEAQKEERSTSKTAQNKIYLPLPGTNIFTSNLPSHERSLVKDNATQNKAARVVSRPNYESTETKKVTSRVRIIDCGPARDEKATSRTSHKSDLQTLEASTVQRTQTRERAVEQAVQDWRFGPISIESVDIYPPTEAATISPPSSMTGASKTTHGGSIKGIQGSITAGPRGQVTKARFEPVPISNQDGILRNTEVGWGIVHLYRDGEESPGLGTAPTANGEDEEVDTTILCIPAVPSYMTPGDFLGWVGEKTREQVSHFRMVMTGKMNRYLVLMKFRDAAVARKWREDWDGRVFGGLEPENCHVMFIKSIVFQAPTELASHSFPDTSHDPFTPNLRATADSGIGTSLALKPFPPPTPSLVELPTCPVCLERMDDTTGLLTILCQHVFHCACLSKWKGSGCPVCRHTQPLPSLSQPFGMSASDLCRVCDCSQDLWICLICGHVGCGRYKGGHAKDHWKETAHNYALEIETQYVWDYVGDSWVHRLIQTKGDGKLVELPSSSLPLHGFGGSRESQEGGDVEMVPRVKLENIGMEYTHLFTSQLESQRLYYEDIVKKAVSKASAASKSAEAAAAKAEEALAALKQVSTDHARLRDETVPGLDKERDRLKLKAEKSGELARTMTKNWQEEKKVNNGLMERINHINEGMANMSKELTKFKAECEELKEQNRDLSFFISSQEKLKDMQNDGEVGEDVIEGTVSLPERKEGKGKGKGRGRGK